MSPFANTAPCTALAHCCWLGWFLGFPNPSQLKKLVAWPLWPLQGGSPGVEGVVAFPGWTMVRGHSAVAVKSGSSADCQA